MADELEHDFGEVEEPEDLEVVELEELEDDDELLADDVLADDDVDVEDELVADTDDDAGLTLAPAEPAAEEEEEEEEDDEEEDLDDVEAGLDVILKDRLVVGEDEEEEEEEEEVPDVEERAEGTTKVLPKRPGEFTCRSCFLLKNRTQLADPDQMLCRDCV